MDSLLIDVSGATLGTDSALLRNFTRPLALRGPDYEAEYDRHTLLYDIFRQEDGSLCAIAPPPLNLPLTSMFFDGPWQVRHRDRCTELSCASLAEKAFVSIRDGSGQPVPLPINRGLHDFFAGERVLLTKSKNNQLPWIRDWAAFHVEKQHVTAVLLYDNASTIYTAEEVLAVLRRVPGLCKAAVVRWPYRYGAHAHPFQTPEGEWRRPSWDSDFSQYAINLHAQRRCLSRAAGVLYCDVDELVFGSKKYGTVFTQAAQSPTGTALIQGDWVVARPAMSEEGGFLLRHRHHTLRLGACGRGQVKWALIPERVGPERQWRIHDIAGVDSPVLFQDAAAFKHCRGISTSWKYFRSGLPQGKELEVVVPDKAMINYARASRASDWMLGPWMDPPEIQAIERRLRPDMQMLEYGMGGSTLYFAPMVARYHAIEHNDAWFHRVRPYMRKTDIAFCVPPHIPAVRPYAPAQPGQYTHYIGMACVIFAPETLDAVLIDGRARIDCAVAVAPLLKPGGLLFFHDFFARPRYTSRMTELLPFYDLVESVRDSRRTLAIFTRKQPAI